MMQTDAAISPKNLAEEMPEVINTSAVVMPESEKQLQEQQQQGDSEAADASPRNSELTQSTTAFQVGGSVLTREQALSLMQGIMNTESQGTSNTWFDTNEHVDEAEDPIERDLSSPTFGVKIGITKNYLLVVNIGGNVVKWDILKIILRVLLFALLLVCLWLALGDLSKPGGAVFAIITTILFGSMIGLTISKATGFPPLIGYLLAGMLWSTTGWNTGVPQLFGSCVRTAALTAILCRAGINFKWSAVKPVALNVALLGIVPQIVEAAMHGFIAKQLFGHSLWLTAILQGAVAAPASNAIVITVLYPLRLAGYSVARGPSILMFIACAFDNVFAVWLINFMLGIMYPAGNALPLWQRVLLAPAQILLGAILGIVGGRIIVIYSNMYFQRNERQKGAWKDLGLKATKRDTALFILLSQGTLILLSNLLNVPGTGTVAAAVAAATISQTWTNQDLESRKNELNKTLADIWDSVIAPTLFSLVGASIDLNTIFTATFLPPALACIFGGLAAKCVVVVILQTGTGLMFKEKIFFAIGLCAKATVQAAMCGKFLDYAVTKWKDHGPEEADTSEQEIALARTVQQVAVLALAVCGIGSGILMKITSTVLLIKDDDYALLIEKEEKEKNK